MWKWTSNYNSDQKSKSKLIKEKRIRHKYKWNEFIEMNGFEHFKIFWFYFKIHLLSTKNFVELQTNLKRNRKSFLYRCCCFFKRKKKKSSRQKWLEAVQECSPEREGVTLLRATSHSNSRDSVLNPSQDYVQATSQHTMRYPSASILTPTPTNTPTLPL